MQILKSFGVCSGCISTGGVASADRDMISEYLKFRGLVKNGGEGLAENGKELLQFIIIFTR
jgi:hypothetical protein